MAKKARIDLADASILRNISEKKQRAAGSSQYALFIRNSVDSLINNLSNAFSWYIGSPAHQKDFWCEIDMKETRDLRVVSSSYYDSVRESWNYLRDKVKNHGTTTDSILTPHTLSTLAYCLDNRNANFRSNDVKACIFDPDYASPSGFQVFPLVASSLDLLKSSSAHPVSKAAYAHLSIVAIQPFEHANKRLARLVQSSILVDYNLPAVVDCPNDRLKYACTLKNALLGFQANDFASQRPFYDYIAEKVSRSLDRADTLGNVPLPVSRATCIRS